MRIRKILSCLVILFVCLFGIAGNVMAATNIPLGDIGEYGNWITKDNMAIVNNNMSSDATSFTSDFKTSLHSTNFIPIEVKIGLAFMKALSSIDYVLQISLVRFVIMFLFIMYAFWIGLEAYKMIRESTDYKKVVFDIFKKGFIIVFWILILKIGPAKIFTMIMMPIMAIGRYLSDFILNAVAQTYNVAIPDTCTAIHDYVAANSSNKLLISPDAAANIMCVPARISVFFYHATATGWEWMVSGFGHSTIAVLVGAVSVVIFIKCILKYAFMTLGVVADLFLTLLMLPFTALAESMPPSTKESNYAGQIYSGFLSVFKAQKISDVISKFINTAIYFASLSIVIAICGALLTNIISITSTNTYSVANAMITILAGYLVLYFADKSDELAKQLGGSVNNAFGKQLQQDTKTLWGDIKSIAGKVIKDISKK